jgi:sialic acid synthase SpsE
MLGDGVKRPMPCEQQGVTTARRSAVARHDLPAGVSLSLADLDFVRPRTGLSPLQAEAVVGRRVHVSLKQHEFVTETHVSAESGEKSLAPN